MELGQMGYRSFMYALQSIIERRDKSFKCPINCPQLVRHEPWEGKKEILKGLHKLLAMSE